MIAWTFLVTYYLTMHSTQERKDTSCVCALTSRNAFAEFNDQHGALIDLRVVSPLVQEMTQFHESLKRSLLGEADLYIWTVQRHRDISCGMQIKPQLRVELMQGSFQSFRRQSWGAPSAEGGCMANTENTQVAQIWSKVKKRPKKARWIAAVTAKKDLICERLGRSK